MTRILLVVVVAETGALVGLVAPYLAHGFWTPIRTGAERRARSSVRAALVGIPEGGHRSERVRSAPHSSRMSRRALLTLGRSLSGDATTGIERAAAELGLAGRAARRCRSRRWWRRLEGVRVLASIGGAGGAGEVVPPLLDDPHPLVRAAAVRWVVRQPSAELVTRVVALLGDPARPCRLAAQDALVRLGGAATTPLMSYLSRERALPGRLGALRAAAGLADPALLQPALDATRDDDSAVRAAGASILAHLGGAPGEAALLGLLADPEEPVRAEAARGLGALRAWTRAPELAKGLRDPSWEVRRSTALALDRLGPTGRLYLRRALGGPDRGAVEIARQVLDLADTSPR